MSNQDHQRLQELLPSYALGALDGAELAELEAHLRSGCVTCQRELAGWNRDVEELAALVEPIEPSQALRQSVLAALEPPRRRNWASLALIAATLAAVVVGGTIGWRNLARETRSLAAERDRLVEELAIARAELVRVETEAAYVEAAMAIVSAPSGRTVALAGLADAPAAHGRTYIDPAQRQALFYAYDLPVLSAEKTYQLWFIADGKPVSAGTFNVDPRGFGQVEVRGVAPIASIQAWAVTIEPAGGVPQPTGSMVLKG